jgi:hypothetical protein
MLFLARLGRRLICCARLQMIGRLADQVLDRRNMVARPYNSSGDDDDIESVRPFHFLFPPVSVMTAAPAPKRAVISVSHANSTVTRFLSKCRYAQQEKWL